MSGRAYARNAQGFLGGGADLESIMPHTFRVAAPKRGNSVRELAIRRVIRRRCMEKNWKKLISRRHTRLTKTDAAASEPNEAEAATSAADQSETDAVPATADAESKAKQLPVSNGTAAAKSPEKKSESSAATGAKAAENGARKPKQEKKPDSETMNLAKRQLEELEAKLQTLVEQKHAKFLQLKNILVEEARSKSSSGSPAPAPPATTPVPVGGFSAPGPSKKRRVDFKEANTGSPRGGAQSQGEQSVVPPLGSPLPATTAAPSASSNSFSSSSAASSEPAAPGNASTSDWERKGVKRQPKRRPFGCFLQNQDTRKQFHTTSSVRHSRKTAMKRHGDGGGDDDGGGNIKSAELLVASPVPVSISAPQTTSSTSLSATSLQNESRKRIARSPVPFGSLSEAFGYVVFLILFIVATSVIEKSEQAFYFANRIKSALVDQPFVIPVTLRSTSGVVISSSPAATTTQSSVQKSFGVIQDQLDVWAFLQGPFTDVIYGPEDDNDGDSANMIETAGMPLSYNRVLGGVRMRTLRVKPDSCPSLNQIPEYSSILPYCYGSFSTDIEQTKGYGPILNSDDITASICFAFAKDFFADKAATKSYADLEVCYSDCERTCGEHFGVEKFRYVAACNAQCGIHCKCVYEQPMGFDNLCPDPNPNGPGAAIPSAWYSYNWSSSKATESLASKGYTGTKYSGSGYVVDLAVNGTLARTALTELREDRYLDLATRALVIDVTVYNAYLQLFNIVQLVIEFPATGGAFVQFSDVVLRPFRYSASDAIARIVLESLLVAYILVSWKGMLQAMYQSGGVARFLRSSAWNVVTLLFLLVFAAVICVRLYMLDQEYGMLSGKVASAIDNASLSEIPKFQSLARLCYAVGVLGSVNAAFVWLKLLQYTQMSKRMCLLLRMLRRATMDLFWFFVYFFVCICGFAQIGYLLFGLSVRQFRSFGIAILALLQAVAGDLDYEELSDAHHVLGSMFYIAFYLLLLLILLNVFLAILNDAYLQTITEQEEEEHEDEYIDDQGSQGRALDEGNESAEAHLSRYARREMEQLHKYPFSKGIGHALRLLVVDLKHTIYKLRTGRKAHLTKVDPFMSANYPVNRGGEALARGGGNGVAAGSSRKWTMQVKKQLDKQIQKHTQARLSQELQEKDREMEALRGTIDREISEKLVVLVESNRQKTQRMHDMEKMLGSIEKLCQKLITDTATSSQTMEQRRIMTKSPGGFGGSGSGSVALQSRGTAVLEPQILSAALRAAHGEQDDGKMSLTRSGSGGNGASKRFTTKKSGTEEIEEITL